MITCGFLEVVKRRGIRTASFKCGPDYIDPMFHRYVLGVEGGNLDSFFQPPQDVRQMFEDRCRDLGAELAVIEGVMGYYDGIGAVSTQASSWEISVITGAPAVLVVDCKGASVSLAALIKGFAEFADNSNIRGVILNRLTPALYGRIRPAVEGAGVPVYGFLPELKDFHLDSRHLGLLLPGEIEGLREKVSRLAEQMEESLDIDGLLRLSKEGLCGRNPQAEERKEGKKGQTAHEMGESAWKTDALRKECPTGRKDYLSQGERVLLKSCSPAGNSGKAGEKRGEEGEEGFSEGGRPRVRIAVARDEAFCFYYQENLRLMETLGAELVFFSPLKDEALPEADGYLFGGGYPENFAPELSANRSMLRSVRAAHERKARILAECGGFLYLHKRLEGADGNMYEMAGLVDGIGFRTNRLSRFGYIALTGPKGETIRGHEFHYWDTSLEGGDWLAKKPLSGRTWRCMVQTDTLLCGFPHLYYPSNREWLAGWLKETARMSAVYGVRPQNTEQKGR